MAPKNIFILGATGSLGIFFCQEALKRGHSLSIFARNPSKLPQDIVEHPNTKITKGSLTDHEALISAVKGSDAVMSALGPPLALSGISVAPGTYTNTYRLIFQAMRDTGMKRIFVMGAPSVSQPQDRIPLSISLVMAIGGFLIGSYGTLTSLFGYPGGSPFTECRATGRLLDEEAEDLDWTMYRVGALSDEEGVTKAVTNIGEGDWVLPTFRPGIASWIVDQIEREEPEWVHLKPALYSVKP